MFNWTRIHVELCIIGYISHYAHNHVTTAAVHCDEVENDGNKCSSDDSIVTINNSYSLTLVDCRRITCGECLNDKVMCMYVNK